jgi:hypothetical protein
VIDPARRQLEVATRNGARPGGVEQRGMRAALLRLGMADQEQIVPRRRRPHRGLADGAELADGAHLEVVGDDDPAIADLAAQIVGHDQPRERGGHARGGIEAWIEGM